MRCSFSLVHTNVNPTPREKNFWSEKYLTSNKTKISQKTRDSLPHKTPRMCAQALPHVPLGSTPHRPCFRERRTCVSKASSFISCICSFLPQASLSKGFSDRQDAKASYEASSVGKRPGFLHLVRKVRPQLFGNSQQHSACLWNRFMRAGWNFFWGEWKCKRDSLVKQNTTGHNNSEAWLPSNHFASMSFLQEFVHL